MLRIRRPQIVGGLAALAVVGAIAGGAATQTAQAGGGLCSVNQVCIFNQTAFSGELGWLGPGNGITNVSSAANDKMKSWQNRTTEDARWYVNADGRGSCYNMPHNTGHSTAEFPNELSSWATNGAC
jgi:hypothetical protein